MFGPLQDPRDLSTSFGNSEVVSTLLSNGEGPSNLKQHLTVPVSGMPQQVMPVHDAYGANIQTTSSLKPSIPNNFAVYSEVRESTAGQVKMNNFDLNDICVDSDDGTEDIERSPAPVNARTSSLDCPSWVQQDSHQSSPPQTSRNSDSASAQSPSSSSGEAQVYCTCMLFIISHLNSICIVPRRISWLIPRVPLDAYIYSCVHIVLSSTIVPK
jgi:hypothetical protein